MVVAAVVQAMEHILAPMAMRVVREEEEEVVPRIFMSPGVPRSLVKAIEVAITC
jgi:hypothetical protein